MREVGGNRGLVGGEASRQWKKEEGKRERGASGTKATWLCFLSELLSALSPNQGLGGQRSAGPLSPLSAGCWFRLDFQGWDLPTS